MSEPGHNGGPSLKRLTDKEFRSFVKMIVQSRLPGHQKLLSIGVASLSDEDGRAELGAKDMMRVCSVLKRDTVFAAKRDIAEDGLGIIATVSESGKPNRYHVMPPRVVASIIEAYNARIAAGGQPIPKKETPPVPQNGMATHPQERDVTRHQKWDATSSPGGTPPVPQNGTSPEIGDGSRAPTHPRIESPSGILPFETEDTNKPKKLGKGGVGGKPSLPEPKRASARRKPATEQFERFWAAYPLRKGKSKAFERFMALTPEQAEKAVVAAQAYAAECTAKGIEDRYRKWPQGWLNERRFEDEIPDPNESLVSPDGKKRWGWWRGKEETLRAIPRERWKAAYERARPNGTWPWWDMTPAPGHVESCFPDDLATELSLFDQYPDGVNHG